MNDQDKKDLAKAEVSYSTRFTNMVLKEFGSTIGTVAFNPMQLKLAQHLFVGIDKQLKDLEAKRVAKGQDKKAPIVWSNINMEKLAIDAVHRVELGLDALIPNHIHPIPYMNSKTGKYDLDLRIGYLGKDYYRQKFAVEEPKDIIYSLVHENDEFEPILTPGAETYKFSTPQPFNRGKVIGGFGYIVFEDSSKNKLIMVSKAEFDKRKAKAQTNDFWGPWEEQMQFKTLVTIATSHLKTDPEKVNASYAAVEMDDNIREIADNANAGDIISLDDDEFSGTSSPPVKPEVQTDENPKDHKKKEEETDPKAAFRANIMEIANELELSRYSATLKECRYNNINDVKKKDYGKVEKAFKEALDKMNAGENDTPQEETGSKPDF